MTSRNDKAGVPESLGEAPDAARVAAMLARPTITPDELLSLKLIPLSRMSIYAACERGDIENVRYGKRIAILTGPLKRRLGMEAA
jgi:hypothetical protein